MNHIGNITKMNTKIVNGIVDYNLPIGNELVHMNPLIGKTLTLNFDKTINCTHCNAQTEKSHKGGYCKSCSETLAQCDTCRTKPDACAFSQGNCRDEAWGLANCFDSHLVYLSFTGSAKVGITRHSSDLVSSRWLDQGATSAIPFLMVSNRLLSGLVENIIKQHISDRTNWRKMLAHVDDSLTMQETADSIKILIADEINALQDEYGILAVQWLDNPTTQHIHYPVNTNGYPLKVKSINLDKTPLFTGKLQGIKGQYLIFDNDMVINMRKYTGYNLNISYA
jgi:hypothetical protein